MSKKLRVALMTRCGCYKIMPLPQNNLPFEIIVPLNEKARLFCGIPDPENFVFERRRFILSHEEFDYEYSKDYFVSIPLYIED